MESFSQQFILLPAFNKLRQEHAGVSDHRLNASAYSRGLLQPARSGSKRNSPQNIIRRRTTATAHAPLRQRSVADGRRRQVNPHLSSSNAYLDLHTRTASSPSPIARRPVTATYPLNAQYLLHGPPPTFSTTQPTMFSSSSVGIPMSQRSIGEPFIRDPSPPGEECSAQMSEERFSCSSGDISEQIPFWQPQFNPNSSWLDLKQPHFEQSDFTQQPWTETWQDVLARSERARSYAASGADVLENAGPDSTTTDDGEELVGMGLYDTPSTVASSFTQARTLSSMVERSMPVGKGLKLEETFEPALSEELTDDESDIEEIDHSRHDSGSILSHIPLAQDLRFGENLAVPALANHSFFLESESYGSGFSSDWSCTVPVFTWSG